MSDVTAGFQVQTRIPTPYGDFMMRAYGDAAQPHLALSYCEAEDGPDRSDEAPLVRIHSECMTGDLFGSLRCDCGPQLQRAFEQIEAAGRGVVIYLRQEGRGIGLVQKLAAYNLQDEGLDTIDANLELGHPADSRDFGVAARMLEDLGHSRIRLLTNNPEKLSQLSAAGIDICERVSLNMATNRHNEGYLATKQNRMGHMLQLNALAGIAGGKL